MSKKALELRQETETKHARAAHYLVIEKGGKCPMCGNVLIPNNSLASSYWLQCRGYGMQRQPTDKACGYQILAGREMVDEIESRE